MSELNNITCFHCANKHIDCQMASENNYQICPGYKPLLDNSKFFAHFFTWKGRIDRLQYFVSLVIINIIYFASYALIDLSVHNHTIDESTAELVDLVFFVPYAYMAVVTNIKRLHDADNPTWIAFIPLVTSLYEPLRWFNLIVFGYVWGFRSTDGINKYGTEPRRSYSEQIEEAELYDPDYNDEETEVEE